MSTLRRCGSIWGLGFCVALLLVSTPASADVFEWIDTGGGLFTDASNWNVLSGPGAPPPAENDTAIFDLPTASFTVSFLENQISSDLQIEVQELLFQPLGSSRTYEVTDDALIAGGTLTLGDGGLAMHLTVEDTLTAYAGTSITATNSSDVTVGTLDIASNLLVPGGGAMVFRGAGATLHAVGDADHSVGQNLTGLLSFVNGANGLLHGPLNLGTSTFATGWGHGAMYVTSGSYVDLESLQVGGGLNRSGELFVRDAGSRLTMSGDSVLTVGGIVGLGTGVITIENGATITTGTGATTIEPTGSVSVVGAGTTFDVRGNLFVDAGFMSVAAESDLQLAEDIGFSIDQGAIVDLLYAPAIRDGQTVTALGNSILTVGGGLTVGGPSTGSVNIDGGHVITNDGASVLAGGEIRLTNGSLTADGALDVRGGSVTMLGSAFVQGDQLVLTIADGGRVSFQDSVAIWPGRRFDVQDGGRLNTDILTISPESEFFIRSGGTLSAKAVDFTAEGAFPIEPGGRLEMDAFLGDLEISAGTVAPGREFPNSAVITGDYHQQSGATLEFELGGTVPGNQYDQLVVAGVAEIAGMLEVKLIDLGSGVFEPEGGDSFLILTAAGGRLGEFDDVLLPTLAGDGRWQLDYNPNSLRLLVLAASDFDSDGDVDGDDFLAWQMNFGTTQGAMVADGDANGDGAVDGVDFLVWQRQFGLDYGGGSTAVPEPASLLAALVLLGSLAVHPRRAR